MWSWLARRMISANLGRLNAGDYRPLVRMDADDIAFASPGHLVGHRALGKEALGQWLQRFVAPASRSSPTRSSSKGLRGK